MLVPAACAFIKLLCRCWVVRVLMIFSACYLRSYVCCVAERDFQLPWIARDREILSLLHQQESEAARHALTDYLHYSEYQLMTNFRPPDTFGEND